MPCQYFNDFINLKTGFKNYKIKDQYKLVFKTEKKMLELIIKTTNHKNHFGLKP